MKGICRLDCLHNSVVLHLHAKQERERTSCMGLATSGSALACSQKGYMKFCSWSRTVIEVPWDTAKYPWFPDTQHRMKDSQEHQNLVL